MLTDEQRAAFSEHGHVRIPGAFDRAAIDAVAERVWAHLEIHRGVRRTDPRTLAIPAPWVGLKAIREEDAYLALESAELFAAFDDLLGPGGWRRPRDWGGFLVTVPDCSSDAWTVPARGWHVDSHFTHEPGRVFALRVFTFLSEVGAHGGGTLVVRGSHRLVDRYVAAMTSEERREGFSVLRDRFLASHPWFRELASGGVADSDRRRLMEETYEIDGVSVLVEELCGSPGDVVVAHPWIVHATSPHAGQVPRMMLGKDVLAEPE